MEHIRIFLDNFIYQGFQIWLSSMKALDKSRLALRFIFVASCMVFSLGAMAQKKYTLDEIFATPHLSQLNAAGDTGDLVFAVNAQGHRNIYIARSPDYQPEKLTNWDTDSGQEITSLCVSPDGQWAVFVRGGEHGGNFELGAVNPASFVERQQILLYAVHLSSGKVTLIGEGDDPVIHPDSKRVSFLKEGQVWIAPMDGSNQAKPLFHVAGEVAAMQWSPEGNRLLFESKRKAYSFIGIFQEGKDRIRWIDPSYRQDRFPRWSPNGQSVTFVRALTRVGGLIKSQVPWSIMVTDLNTDKTDEIWVGPATAQGGSPGWPGTYNLRWLMEDAITFLSYQDGWPHLYKVDPRTRKVQQLTRGDFTVEQMSYSGDGSKILLAANTGSRKDDIDRKHIGIVDVAAGTFDLLTNGLGIETDPIFVRKTEEIAFFSNAVQRPPLPTLMKVNDPNSQKIIASSLLPDFDYQQLVTPEHVTFQSEDGHPVYGQVFRPKDQVKDAPAIVYIHGGPPRQMLLGWHFADYYFHDYMLNQYLASQGYVVLSVNYRLGTGYGYDFQHAKNTGGFDGIWEYRDIYAAGKWLVEQSYVDADRIGVYGGSYGGFLTAVALSRNSDLFKVGVDIHGAHYRMLGHEGPKSSRADSITADWTSPILIIHGDDDKNVRFTESVDLANRLLGKGVDVEYLVFPDENHHWMLFENLIKVNEATVRFIEGRMPIDR